VAQARPSSGDKILTTAQKKAAVASVLVNGIWSMATSDAEVKDFVKRFKFKG
jgi:hypothetical protein